MYAILGVRDGEEVGIGTLSHADVMECQNTMAAIGEDLGAGPLRGPLATAISPKLWIATGDADRLEA